MSVECPMCLKVVPKLKSDSHVLPRFFLRPIRDSHGQVRTIDVLKAIIDHKSQDLPKGEFICANCESLTAKLDGYGAHVLNQSSGIGLKVMEVPFGRVTFVYMGGIQFSTFRNFLLSIVVRDHCWRKSVGMTTIMNPSEYESMRILLLSEDVTDEATFRIVMHKINEMLIPNLHKTTSPPVQSALKDAVTFMGLGYAFMIYYKIPTPENMKHFSDMCGLKSNGSISMPKANLFDIGTWKKSQNVIAEAYDKLQKKIANRKNI